MLALVFWALRRHAETLYELDIQRTVVSLVLLGNGCPLGLRNDRCRPQWGLGKVVVISAIVGGR